MAGNTPSVEMRRNILVDDISLPGTIGNCRAVLSFLLNQKQDEDCIRIGASMGLSWILETVDDALKYVENAMERDGKADAKSATND